MHYEIEVGGVRRRVDIRPEAGTFNVSIDGRSLVVDAARIDSHTVSLLVEAGSLRVSREVAIDGSRPGGSLHVSVGAARVPVELSGSPRGLQRPDRGAAGVGPQRLVAPMPGKVVRLLVEAGAKVTARQPVIVVEAMKMENELRAARGGVVTEIAVSPGQSVEAGALLVVLAPGETP
jgi:biotin carboxyl carrier protein